jgi:hypothetical protein
MSEGEQPEMPDTATGARCVLSEAIALSSLGVYCYALAFVYEAGYFGAFGIPLHLIQTSIDTVFVLVMTIGAALYLVYGIVNLVAMLWPKHPIIQVKIIRIASVMLLVLWPGLVYGFKTADRVSILIAVLILLLLEVAWPVFVYRKRGALAKRFEADETAEDPTRARTLLGRLQLAAGPLAYWLVLIGYLGLALAHSAGRAEATRKEEHYFIENDPLWIVVRVYPTAIVAVPFDSATGTVQRGIMVRNFDASGIKLVRESVGPLKLGGLARSRKEP